MSVINFSGVSFTLKISYGCSLDKMILLHLFQASDEDVAKNQRRKHRKFVGTLSVQTRSVSITV